MNNSLFITTHMQQMYKYYNIEYNFINKYKKVISYVNYLLEILRRKQAGINVCYDNDTCIIDSITRTCMYDFFKGNTYQENYRINLLTKHIYVSKLLTLYFIYLTTFTISSKLSNYILVAWVENC
jgi:hypothetical protein